VKAKRALAKQVLAEALSKYDFGREITAPLHELIGIPDVEKAKVMTLTQMERFIADNQVSGAGQESYCRPGA